MRRGGLASLWVLAWSAQGALAQSAPAPIRLQYQRGPGAETCPDEAQLREAIAAHLGFDPFADQGKRVLEITVERVDSNLMARVTIVGENGTAAGERVLRSSSPECRDLAAVVTLAVSMVLDPLAGESAPAGLPPIALPPPAPTVSPVEAAAVSASAPEPAPRPHAGPDFEVGVAFLGAVGAVSSPNLGLQLQLAVAWPLFSLGLEGRADFPVSQQLATGSVDTSQLTASLVPCLTRWHLGLCALVTAGATRVQATGIEPSGSQLAPYVGLGGRAFGGVSLLDWLEARLQLDLLGQLTHTSIMLDGSTVWSAPPVSGTAALALVARFR